MTPLSFSSLVNLVGDLLSWGIHFHLVVLHPQRKNIAIRTKTKQLKTLLASDRSIYSIIHEIVYIPQSKADYSPT